MVCPDLPPPESIQNESTVNYISLDAWERESTINYARLDACESESNVKYVGPEAWGCESTTRSNPPPLEAAYGFISNGSICQIYRLVAPQGPSGLQTTELKWSELY